MTLSSRSDSVPSHGHWRVRAVAALAALGILLAGCGESNPAAERAASTASEPWLALLDAGDYAGAWEAAGPLFREMEGRESWIAKAEQYRAPLGAFKARQPQDATYLTNPWGAPAGAYAAVVYDSRWERGTIYEIVTMQQQPDGAWLPAGYDVADQ